MKKLQSYIVGCSYSEFPDKKTGEMLQFTKISYLMNGSDTDTQIGSKVMTCIKRGDYRTIIKENCNKTVNLEIEEVPQDNGCKYIIKTINLKELK